MKKYIFVFIFVILMVVCVYIFSEIMCFGFGGVKLVNFEIKIYYDLLIKFLFGFVWY